MLFAAETLYYETYDSKYHPPSILRKYERTGRLERKSGEGFLKYPES